MKLSPHSTRRRLLLTATASVLASPVLALAQAYPSKPIRLVVPSAAGGSPDAICCALAVELAKGLGQTIVVDNKAGASGMIGIQEVIRAAPDGHTLGYANVGTLAINQSLLGSNLNYDADKQLVGLALLGHVQNALVVRPELPVKNVAELIAYAKQRPGKLSMGSAGVGTTGHLGGELFKEMAGVFMVHVPYRGSPQAIQDLIGGQVDVMFDNLTSIAPHMRSGRVRALAVSRADPSAAGKSLFDIARERGQAPDETARSLQPAGAVYFAMHEADVRRILAHPLSMIGSDGLAHDERPHPRLWGSFARVLGHYARDENLFSLPTAVHKMTGLTASRFGLKDRGVIEVGAFADMVLLDPRRIIDRATYADPEAEPAGIVKVWVNGVLACADGEVVNSTAGRLLRR